ncbi:MAG: hypothetical protein HF973_13915, partial [Chloroflexi bacterium]|nr:hypothetical protein [Chloroflexota bacterium]
IDQPFPPPPPETAPPEATTGPLEVIRYSPEGEVDLAPFLSVTFNQPMVPLGTQEALAAKDVPVKLTPELPGVWKWVGTQTLTFEYAGEEVDRFPMAAEYRAEVPAGTTSANGGVLAEAVAWTFLTPPPRLVDYYPSGGPQPLEPLIYAAFDQLIEPTAVLPTIQLIGNGETFPLRLATAEEIAADDVVGRLADGAPDGRYLIFRAENPLPPDTQFTVQIGPGTPSAEGPRRTAETESFDFFTYPPLTIVESQCGWGGECPPLAPFVIRFSNPLDTAVYDESMIQISPELPGARVNIYGDQINIEGLTQGRTTYTVRVSGDLQDVFGQTLGQDETLKFKIGSAQSALSGPDRPLITLDPSAAKPVFTVYAINYNQLRVRVYAVEPADWPTYLAYLQEFRYDQPSTPPGREVMNELLDTNAIPDALTEIPIDLSGVLDGSAGHLIVVVEPAQKPGSDYYPIVQTWAQVTQIGLDAFSDYNQMVIWATSLQDGAPLAGAEISLLPNGAATQTGADGVARLDIPDSGASMLTARLGDDTVILPANTYYWDDYGWQPEPPLDELRWYVFDDRSMYRPGEEVHVKGWIRRIGGRRDGDVGLPGSAAQSVVWQLIGPQGNELGSGEMELTALGGFDLAFTLPESVNLGYANLQFTAVGDNGNLYGQNYGHNFQIQEFRRPEFEVAARNETTGPYFVGDTAVLAVTASYFAGGPLPNAAVTWNVATTPSSYSPPNWPDFIFGQWQPWWWLPIEPAYSPGFVGEEGFYDVGLPYPPDGGETTYETFTGFTDASGTHYLQLDFEEMTAPRPFSVMADATVMDVNRQAWTAGTSLLVHPAARYVGLRSATTFVEQGDPLEIEVIVTDIDGSAIPGAAVAMEAGRLEWNYRNGEWVEELADAQVCQITSESEPVSCEFDTAVGGEYRITAVVTDEQGRQNETQFTRWVSGGPAKPSRNVEQEEATLIPDKAEYQPGETAEILVVSPFGPAEGLLTVSRSGILYTERFQITDSSATLRVPIAEEHVPNLHVQVDLVGSAPRLDDAGEPLPDAPPRPAFASGSLTLNVPPRSRTLAVQLTPQATELEPGAATTVNVTVTDAAGRPVPNAEIALVVVDEAVLALTNYQLADPLSVFYQLRPSLVSAVYSRSSIILANPEQLALEDQTVEVMRVVTENVAEAPMEEEMAMAAPQTTAMPFMDAVAETAIPADKSAADTPIAVRSDFNPLAAFAPAVYTDANGRAQVTVQLPDNLTRYRVMAVAVAGEKQFGSAEANVTARLPLMVRPSAPRFLNYGDVFELPVVLQNQTDEPLTVDAAIEATNLTLTGSPGVRVTVPANDRVEVRFPAETAGAGTARIRIAAVSGDYADAATVELPVYTPATTEAFATYGVVDEGAIAQPLLTPENVIPQYGGLEINTSSTALQALTDAVLYLTDYPYESAEAAASRILSIASLRDVLTAFNAEDLPAPEEMDTAVQRDIETLAGLQNFDGGFPYWERGKESIPYVTIYAAHALQTARDKGYDAPEETLENVRFYLTDIESYYPDYYSEYTRNSLSAYALYVRLLMGDADPVKALNLYQETGNDGLSLEGLAWLWQVMAGYPGAAAETDAIYRHILNSAVETAGAANFITSYGDDAYLMMHSNRRTDGIILDGLIRVQPESDLIPKVVNGLLAHRVNGRWQNTQENTFILLALDRYFNTFEAQTPQFVARIWLGETFVGEHAYDGRTTDRQQTIVPMSYLTGGESGAAEDIILQKNGTGRLYYRLGLRYAPSDLTLEPLEMGFTVQRIYEAVDDPADVTRDEDGVWRIKAGARVRVTLTLVAPTRRYHVALVDPLPAGLEIVNPATAVSGGLPPDPGRPEPYYGWWWRNWYEHQNMRDERVEAFTALLWDGVYTYSYVARATTPGAFVVPPAKAEEMYSPEVFGRSGTDRVVVADD